MHDEEDIVESIIREAAELSARERDAFVDGICGGDKDLRARICARFSEAEKEASYRDRKPPLNDDLTLPMEMKGTGASAGEVSSNRRGLIDEFGFPKIPNCVITGILGEGGMGTVYRGRQPDLDREVAIKLLKREISEIDPSFEERFRLEARALAKLNHRNIVAVYDSGETAAGDFYFVMEFVEGGTLLDRIREGPIEPREAYCIFEGVSAALSRAHEEGIVHRDIKSANILLGKQGEVKVADFGIAKLVKPEETGFGMTQTGVAMGTPRYWAPEQSDPEGIIDHRTDIYAAGMLLYEMLCGDVPANPYVAPSQVSVCDSRIDELVEKAISPDQDARFDAVEEFRVGVEEALTTRSPRSRFLLNLAAGGIAALLAGLLALTPVSRKLEWIVDDLWMQLRPPIVVSEDLAVVVITNECLEKVGQWPWGRERHARFLDAIAEQGARSVAFDILFAEASDDRDGDQAMMDASRSFGRVIYAASFLDGSPPDEGAGFAWKAEKALLPIEEIHASAMSIGHTSSNPDSDAKRRRAPLLINYRGSLVPNLGLASTLAHLGVSGENVIPAHNRLFIQLNNGDEIEIPFGPTGEIRINYPSGMDSISSYRYSDFLQEQKGEALRELEGKSLIVGYWAEGVPDVYPTPMSDLTPGVMAHAAIANSILTRQFLREAGTVVRVGILIGVALLVSLIGMMEQRGFWMVALFLLPLLFLAVGFGSLAWGRVFIPVLPGIVAFFLGMLAVREVHRI